MKHLIVVAVFFVSALAMLPDFTQAQGFVPCDGAVIECNACSLVAMANTGIIFLFGLVGLIFAVIMMRAGLGLVTSGGNQSALESAKRAFQNAIIGLIIVMSAWLLVDTIMRGVVGGGGTGVPVGEIVGWGPWSEVKCAPKVQTVEWEGDPASPSQATSTPPLPSGPVAMCTGGDCVPIGVPCKDGIECLISPDMAPRLQAMHAAAGVAGARVTEAMPPTRIHKSVCHTQGTCVDYSKSGGMTGPEVISVINAARANSLRPVYEVVTQAEKDALVSAGAPADTIKVLGSWISASHFSIYGY
jgi:hypothetical protein